MTEQPIIVRKPIAQTNELCDWEAEGHSRIIRRGKPVFQIRGDETILAQGNYHNKICYDQALGHYKKLKGDVAEE